MRALAIALVVGVVFLASPQAIRVDGTRFVDAEGRPFAWRGITAFRLVEKVASGRGAESDSYLEWCRAHGVTIVRVFAMAKNAFALAPAKGAAALPKLLAIAARHDVRVEVVA